MIKLVQEIRRKLRAKLKIYLYRRHLAGVRKEILSYYKGHPSTDLEVNLALTYLNGHRLGNYFGNFQEKYRSSDVRVQTDPSNGLRYVVTPWGNLYFKRSQNIHTIRLLYNGLIIEQDAESPHCYTDDRFFISENDILADIGCAEGLFSLMNISLLKKVYLFEQDKEWIEALEATFSPWKEKVVIVPKYVSDRNTEKEISLNAFFENTPENPHFFKIDVEGAEQSVLEGMSSLMNSGNIKVALCTYHQAGDFEKFSAFFEKNKFGHYANKGLMVFVNNFTHIAPPFFRKGLIKAFK